MTRHEASPALGAPRVLGELAPTSWAQSASLRAGLGCTIPDHGEGWIQVSPPPSCPHPAPRVPSTGNQPQERLSRDQKPSRPSSTTPIPPKPGPGLPVALQAPTVPLWASAGPAHSRGPFSSFATACPIHQHKFEEVFACQI